ncbi:LolA-like putative outer membrane lipoprotein chaperone [uncultured Phocaeicola sp.]|uniref:LolA-like putative outer membrane lipoprotein chaperone n=1 Tax=uncultured Phocaeicola sp. TaxID=990718 RepID=UPI0025EF5919|nr:LolA-like putative outer membrane lipoprotein chaperone [uncultured Phocaeicola sp.]
MKRFYLLGILFLLATVSAWPQQAAKAKKLLDQTTQVYQNAGGISIHFTGSQDGKILLDGNRFYLECGGIKSWFDGRTQWSYVSQNDEVTVSNPTDEELQAINPYTWISMYQQGFNYQYGGQKSLKGKSGEEVILTPKKKQDIKQITLLIGKNNVPQYICIESRQGEKQEIVVQSYRDKQHYNDQTFRFNARQYPHAEVIDMR